MTKKYITLSKKNLKNIHKSLKLLKNIENCKSRKCRKVITKKKLSILEKKHLNESVKCMKTNNYIKCSDNIDKQDKYGLINIRKQIDECLKKNCSKETKNFNVFQKLYDKI
jgi:hypothetical protein